MPHRWGYTSKRQSPHLSWIFVREKVQNQWIKPLPSIHPSSLLCLQLQKVQHTTINRQKWYSGPINFFQKHWIEKIRSSRFLQDHWWKRTRAFSVNRHRRWNLSILFCTIRTISRAFQERDDPSRLNIEKLYGKIQKTGLVLVVRPKGLRNAKGKIVLPLSWRNTSLQIIFRFTKNKKLFNFGLNQGQRTKFLKIQGMQTKRCWFDYSLW